MVVITATLLRDMLRRFIFVASIIVASLVVMMAMLHLALMHVAECRVNIATVRVTMASERNNIAGRHHRGVQHQHHERYNYSKNSSCHL